MLLLLLAAAASRQPVKGHSRQLLAALCSTKVTHNTYGTSQHFALLEGHNLKLHSNTLCAAVRQEDLDPRHSSMI
jgi:hypothetical protein